MIKYFCDKCNIEVTYLGDISEINIDSAYCNHPGSTPPDYKEYYIDYKTISLCSDCAKEFNNTLEKFFRN